MSAPTGGRPKVIGKQHRDGGDGSDARQHADQRADQRADQAEQNIPGPESDPKAQREVRE